jgi:solute carrier family 20 (sodium-dependent phosphate transporter)
VKAKLATYEAKTNTPRKIYERQWREDFRNATVLGKVYLVARYVIMFGIDGREITDYNQGDRTHLAFAPRHEGRTEDMYKSLNVITSCIQSFAHGSNDVANAIGPLSTIYYVWVNNKIPGSNSPVELWQLAYGGAMISLGLWFYGYNIMRVLGNNLTYQSPSRGFCMDVGSAITVIIASKEGFPVSTTQCITGATVGVGIANGDWRSVNWKLFLKIFAGWVITLPAAGLIAGCIFGFVAYSPSATFSATQV